MKKTLLEKYKKFLQEENIEGMDYILEQTLEDEEAIEIILALNREYEERNDLTPTLEQKQKSLQRLQKLLSSKEGTETSLLSEQQILETSEENSSKHSDVDLGPQNKKSTIQNIKANTFQKATLVAEIIDQCHKDNTFGAVKCQKIIYLCEMHAQLESLQTIYYREVAGPFNNNLFYGTISTIEKQDWFQKIKGEKNTRFIPSFNKGGHSLYFDNYWGNKRNKIHSIINIFRQFNTAKTELIATLYAVWNDLIIEGKQPEDIEIIHKFYEWNISKIKYSESDCLATLDWMKKNDFIPNGFGRKTEATKKRHNKKEGNIT